MRLSSEGAASGFRSPSREPAERVVLHVVGCRSVQYGSFEDNLVSLAAVCSRRGLTSVFVYPEQPAVARFCSDVDAAGGRLLIVPDSDQSTLRGARAIARAIRETRPRVVHAHFGRPGYFAVAIARAYRVPTVLLMKHHQSWPEVSRGHRLALRAIGAVADGVLCVSPVVADEVLAAGVPARKTRVTPLGIDTARYAPAPELRDGLREELVMRSDARLVLCVSHLREPKGVDVLLDAWDLVYRGAKDATLLLAGTGPLARELEEQAQTLAWPPSVRFLGIRHDVPRLLAACDLFVCPSLSEAGGLNIAEALASGIPTVSTLVGVVRDLGAEGLFVPVNEVGDAPALADAIESALADDALRERIAIAGREYALRHLSLNRIAESLADVYRDGVMAAGAVVA